MVQNDGKIITGGNTTTIQGMFYTSFHRLNTDGSLDTSFGPAIDTNGSIKVLGKQPDGKVLLGGDFGGQSSIVRLNADGSVDTGFNSGDSLFGDVVTAAVQTDGKIIVGGNFFLDSDTDRTTSVTRLKANGSLDPAFNPGTGPDASYSNFVTAIAIQPNGKILIGGSIVMYQGEAVGKILLLNVDGTRDHAFTASIATQDSFGFTYNDIGDVRAIALQPDGKAVVAGQFNRVGGAAHLGIARLDANGSVDAGFNPVFAPSQYSQVEIDSLTLQSDGKLLTGGNFASLNGVANSNFARLNGGSATNPTFFNGETALGSGVYYLAFANGNPFGYYSYLSDAHYLYHYDLGYEYVFNAADGQGGVYFYDFKSGGFFYTSPSFPFPYLYDFSLNSTVYYYPDPNNPGHYNTNGTRYFYVFSTGEIISK